MGRQKFYQDPLFPPGKLEGNRVAQYAVAVFDFAKHGGAVGDHKLGVSIPAKAVIIGGFYDVLTTFTSANDSATVGLEAGSADLVAAVAISNEANPWDAGVHGLIPDFTAAKAVKTTAAVELIVDVGVQAITAGKAVFVVQYMVTG